MKIININKLVEAWVKDWGADFENANYEYQKLEIGLQALYDNAMIDKDNFDVEEEKLSYSWDKYTDLYKEEYEEFKKSMN